MEKQLILVSHGHFATELKKSTEMIMGPQDNIHAVGLLESEGPEDFQAKVEAILAAHEGDDFVIFADLQGGTPCNVVSRMVLEGASLDIYAGMNMPMVIAYLNYLWTGQEADFVEKARQNTLHVNSLLFGEDDDDLDE